MRRHFLTFVSLCLCAFVLNTGPLQAEDNTESKAQVTKTERVDFPPAGVLRLTNSVGELTIVGWDRPDVEITTIKSTRSAYGSKERENAARNLDRIQVKAERHGDEVLITTEFPRYSIFPPPLPWRNEINFDLEYRISAPRNARLVIDHVDGEVHVDDLMGDFRVTVQKGGLTLRLPDDSYAIDAKSDVGSIFSDFPGNQHSRRLHLGTQFTGQPSTAANKLYLRTGFGDIAITKIRKAPYVISVNPSTGSKQ
jgi:hypothetical protein